MKSTAILLSLFLFIMPFFQPKKVKAVVGVDDAILVATIATALIAARYVQTNVLYTPEQMNQINEKWTANLQTAFPDPADYNHQMNVLQNLNQKLLNGEEVDWSKYNGKALYAVLKGVVDVVWPTMTDAQKNASSLGELVGYYGNYAIFVVRHEREVIVPGSPMWTFEKLDYFPTSGWYTEDYGTFKNARVKNDVSTNDHPKAGFHAYIVDVNGNSFQINNSSESGCHFFKPPYTGKFIDSSLILTKFLGLETSDQTSIYRPSLKDKLPDKVKLPTRLPQTVINNINNYIDGSTENLIVNPTPDELPTLPDGYNPVTDDLINLPGYEDVTPDQPGSEAPEPTPTPTPPEPTPEYNGDKWVNPIGDFMDGLLKFMKAAFVPTLSLNLDALNSMPDNLSEKFPFSLPGDLVRLFSVFQAEPVPFAFDWEMDFTAVGAGKIPIKGDLSLFDEYAPLFRNLAFIIGLAWKTFGMFFGGGDE